MGAEGQSLHAGDRCSAAEKTAGGIIIPDQYLLHSISLSILPLTSQSSDNETCSPRRYQSKVNEGEVLAVGPGARDKDVRNISPLTPSHSRHSYCCAVGGLVEISPRPNR